MVPHQGGFHFQAGPVNAGLGIGIAVGGRGAGSLLLAGEERGEWVADGADVAGPVWVAPGVEIFVGRTGVALEVVVLHVVPDINLRDSGGAPVPSAGGAAGHMARRQVL